MKVRPNSADRAVFASLGADGQTFAMNSVDLGGKAPTEIQLMPIGKWDGYRQPGTGKVMNFEVTPDHVRAAVAYHQERRARNAQRDLVIDYEHQTLSGGEAPAAGWIGDLKDGGADGLIGTGLNWTAKAKAYLEAGEYRYISPVFSFNSLDKVTGRRVPMAVFNAGLTNEPFFDELRPLVSKDNSLIYFFAKEASMDPVLQFLISFLALAATAKPDDVVAKANQFIEQLRGVGIVAKDGATLTADAVVAWLKDQKANAETLQANYLQVAKALKADAKATPEQLIALIAKGTDTTLFVARSEYDALRAKIEQREIDELIASAIAKGKITPATQENMKAWAAKDLDGFKAFLAKTAEYSAVPLKAIEVGREQHRSSAVLTDEDRLVAKALGVDEKKLEAAAAK